MTMEKEKLVSLVSKARQGDSDALNQLFNAFYNDVYYFALKTVKDENLACDITQETFVEIINTLGNLKEPAAFVTWMKQITYHQCTRYFKKKKDVLVDEDEEGASVFDTVKEEGSEFIPDEALDQSDLKKTILAILDELSEEQRSATMMYYFDEMSVHQIAEIQGVSEGTVKSRLNYARKSIKASVEDYEKKNNIKLHAVPFFPFIKWIFEGGSNITAASASAIAEGVAAATGTAVTVTSGTVATAAVTAGTTGAAVATGTAVTTGTATATTVTTAATVGIGAKIAAIPLVTKLIAGVVAAAVVIGGTTTAVVLSNKENGSQTNNSTASSENTPSASNSDATLLVLDGVIPEGCTYTLYDGTVLTAGQEFPETCTAGDKVLYGDYYYGYECVYAKDIDGAEKDWYMLDETFDTGDSGVTLDDILGGWTPAAIDRTKTEYGSIVNYINGKPIINLFCTFQNCEKMVFAPEIPETVASISMAFYKCYSLKTAPVIPQNVKRITGAFWSCYMLSGDVQINAELDKSLHWYYSDVFHNTYGEINLTGDTPEEDLFLIVENSNNQRITVNGKEVVFYYDQSRLRNTGITPQELVANLKFFYDNEIIAGYSGDERESVHCFYSNDSLPSHFNDFDVFGYGITPEEFLAFVWGYMDFGYTMDPDGNVTEFDNFQYSLLLNMRTEEEILTALNRDIKIFLKFLGGEGDPYIMYNGQSARGLDAITSDMIAETASGATDGIRMFTSQCLTSAGNTEYMLELNCREADGHYVYQLNFQMQLSLDSLD